MRESELEKKCCELARESGWLAAKLTSWRGASDRIYTKDGLMFVVEFKAEGKTVKKDSAQDWNMNRRFARINTPAYECNSLYGFHAILEKENARAKRLT